MTNYRSKPDPAIRIIFSAIDDSKKTLEEISEKSGVSLSTLYNWQRGYTHFPQHITLSAVAKALGMQWKLLRSNQ